MRLRLTTPAARQLDRVLGYIAQHNPQGAHRVQERISDVLNVLLQHPYAGHRTARPGPAFTVCWYRPTLTPSPIA